MAAASDSAMLEAALAYAGVGLAVFPLRPRSKEPATAHGCKDATTDEKQIRAWWVKRPNCNVGIATGSKSGGLVAIDLDVHPDKGEDGTATLETWERAHGSLPETASSVTGSGGRHILLRVGGECRNSANEAVGVDVRGEGGYIVAPPSVHPGGGAYRWDLSPLDCGVATADGNAMAFIESVRPGARKLAEAVDGTGAITTDRNETLFRLACSLMARSVPEEEVRGIVERANAERCVPPLSGAEVAKLLRSALTRYAPGHSEEFDREHAKPAKFSHRECAERLIDERFACLVGDVPAIWDGERYELGYDGIERSVIDLFPDAKTSQRSEVCEYIRLRAPRVEQARPELIAFNNGVLDVETMELHSPSPEHVVTNVIPHDWVPGATSELLDRTMTAIADGDPRTELNLFEFMGLAMFRSARYAFAPVLLGRVGSGASNGKSTYIGLVADVVGSDNVTALPLSSMGDRFMTRELMGKLANLADDVAPEFVTGANLEVFKKAVSGSLLFADVKNRHGFMFASYATTFISANRMPRLAADEGVMRRLFPIRFNAVFEPGRPGYDPDLGGKLRDERVLEAACVRAVDGLRRVMANKRPTANAESEHMKDEIAIDNSSLLQWMHETGTAREGIEGRTPADVFADYRSWAVDSAVRNPFGSRGLSNEIRDRLGLVGKPSKDASGRSIRVYASVSER